MSIEAKCKCQNCDGHLAFPYEMAGQTVICPNCKMETVLFIPPSQAHPTARALASPEQKKRITKRVQVWLCILVILSPVAYVAWSIKRMADEQQDIANTNARSTNYERFKADTERNAAIRAEEYQEWVGKVEGHQETNHR
jgi:hypothetical protein